MQPLELLQVFVEPLEAAGIPYMVTGSVATIIYGEPRLTHDLDLVLLLNAGVIEQLAALFPTEDYYCPPVEVMRIEAKRRPRGHFNLIHHASGFKADIYPYSGDALHQWAMAHRRRLTVPAPRMLWVAPPEYVITRKLQYLREGGSEKHVRDILGMLEISAEIIDRALVERFVEASNVTREWAQVLAATQRRGAL